MLLFELFDKEYPGEWQKAGSCLLRGFHVDGKQYVAQLERKNIPGNLAGYEVSFFRGDIADNEASHSTTSDQSFPTIVYSYLFGMLAPLYAEQGGSYRFLTELRHSSGDRNTQSKKGAIYLGMAKRLAKRKGGYVYVSKVNKASEFLLTKEPLKPGNPYWVNE